MASACDKEASIDDLLWVADNLPIKGSTVALNEEQRSYLIAAAERYGVSRTWKALTRAVHTGKYGPDDVVRVTWAILKGQREKAHR